MESKKTQQSDLKKWSGTWFNLGLVCSLGLVLVAFEWKAYDQGKILVLKDSSDAWEDLDIPVTIQTPPPPPPPPVQVEIIQIPDDIEIDKVPDFHMDINVSETDEIKSVELEGPPIIDDADEIIDFVEVQASFNGGMDAWYAYLNKNLKYPAQARRMGVEGVVIVRFVVNTDGSVQDIELLRTIGGGCDEVAKTVIENSPNWIPGKMGSQAVRSRMTMPIRFRLN